MSCGCNYNKPCQSNPPCAKPGCPRCTRLGLNQQTSVPSSTQAQKVIGGQSSQVRTFENKQLNYDFWQQTSLAEHEIQEAENERNPMGTFWNLDHLIDEEKIEQLGEEYNGRDTPLQKNLAFANLPDEQQLDYYGQRFPTQPHIEHLSAFATQNGHFFEDPWDRIVYQQQFKHWQEVEGQLAHARDVQNFWMR